jgi:phosphopantetheinyl transferase
LEIWTAKEAMLKLAGKGIAAGLDKARVMENGEGFLESTRVFLHRFETDVCLGAVASFSPIQTVREATY